MTNLVETLVDMYGAGVTIQRVEMFKVGRAAGMSDSEISKNVNKCTKVARGFYRLPAGDSKVKMAPAAAPAPASNIVPLKQETPSVKERFNPNAVSEHIYSSVPLKDKTFVPFGEYNLIRQIIGSNEFFPVFISGHSGNGKTFMVEQACAAENRKMIRVQMSRETDEDDLIGGFRLINGETKFMKGPVLVAMETGSVILIDEADRADPGKAMCLQGILEGKPYYMKKTGEIITPAPGFNVIVTANTKGRGSEDGKYVAATMLDDAWLERFPITIEQEYPTVAIEKRILKYSIDEEDFIEHLTAWSDIIRKTFNDGAIDELISTRRLVHIAKTYKLVGDRKKAIGFCINRFDEETKTAFLDLYSKVDPTINPVKEKKAEEVNTSNNEVAF